MKIRKKHIITFSCFGLGIAVIGLSSQLLPGGEISLAHSQTENFHIVEVQAKDLSYPFFGTSFHLSFDPSKYAYDHFSLGSYFQNADPLVQIAPNGNEVIVGISLKRGALINKKDGMLLKLFFNQKSPSADKTQFRFSSPVYSSYNNGRKDINNIIFK